MKQRGTLSALGLKLRDAAHGFFKDVQRSFYGDLHVHGTDGIEFFTRKKVVVTRW